jgi:hypothetical protein
MGVSNAIVCWNLSQDSDDNSLKDEMTILDIKIYADAERRTGF